MQQERQQRTRPTPMRSGRSRSLGQRLITLLVGMLLITLLVIGAGVFIFIARNEQRVWQVRQREAAWYAGETVAAFMRRAEDMLTMMSTLDQDYLRTEPQVMRDLLAKNPALLEVIRLDKSGQVVASADQDTPVLANLFTIPQSNWFLAAKTGDRYLSGIQISSGNEPYLIMAMPATDGGVAAARLRMNMLWDTVANIQFGEGGLAYVVNQKGEIIAHARPDVALVLTNLDGRPEMVSASQAPNHEWNGSYENFEGTRVVGVTAPVPGTDWVVITEIPQSEAFAVSRTALLLIGVGMSIFGILMGLVASRYFVRRLIVRPVEELRAGAQRIGQGDLSHRINIVRWDEIGELASTFNQMADELQELYGQIAARSRDLERRTRYLQATAEVAHDVSSVLDLQELLSRVVTLVSEQFGFYHTGIFLLDRNAEWAVLRAANSEGGQRMLARGHRLKAGEVGIVGYVTGSGEPRIALDVGEDAVYFDNPDLPDTRSEMALPLRAHNEIIGALDVQSTEAEAFSDEEAAVLQTLADQVAMAISNARLFQQAQESLEAERRAYGELSRQAWRELLRSQPDLAFLSDERGTAPAGDLWKPHMANALRTGRATSGDADGTSLAVPIKVRDQVVGVIDAHKSEYDNEWMAQEVSLMEILAQQLGLALESSRLYQDSQRRAERERVTREITNELRRATSAEGIVQSAVDALFDVLGTSHGFGHLKATPQAQDTGQSSQP